MIFSINGSGANTHRKKEKTNFDSYTSHHVKNNFQGNSRPKCRSKVIWWVPKFSSTEYMNTKHKKSTDNINLRNSLHQKTPLREWKNKSHTSSSLILCNMWQWKSPCKKATSGDLWRIYPSIHPPTYSPTCPSIHRLTHPHPIHPPTHPHTHLYLCTWIYVYICISVCMYLKYKW